MSYLSFDVPSSVATSGTSPTQEDLDNRALFGRDFYYDVREGTHVDLHVTKAGDWLVVTGIDAMTQSLIRRMITDPGEWAYLPDYGAGMRSFVKQPKSVANLAEMQERCKAQAMRDRRVKSVSATLELFDGGVKLLLSVVPKFGPERAKPIVITIAQTSTGVL